MYTFSENMLIMVIIMIVMVTMVIMVIKVVRVASVKSSIGIFTHEGHISNVNAIYVMNLRGFYALTSQLHDGTLTSIR